MNLRLAIQGSGRLHEQSVKLLEECGIRFNNGMNRLRAEAVNFPMEILFLRDDDIPQYIFDGVADAGIVGENLLLEKNLELATRTRLGFSKCRLSLALPRSSEYENVYALEGKKIATSYPFLTKKFLEAKGVNAEIHVISGSVEIAPGIGLADAICDLVSSGSTLLQNGLKEAEVILQSEAVLVSRKTSDPAKEALLRKLLFRISSVRKAKPYKYILLNAPDSRITEICKLLPGMKSPTILPLATKGWSSLHSVIHEDDFWNIIEQLKNEGAEGILVLPIEKMII